MLIRTDTRKFSDKHETVRRHLYSDSDFSCVGVQRDSQI